MLECPRCFWLTQHKVWKRPTGIFPSLPSGMDRILKIHFDKFRDEGKLPPEIAENLKTEGIKLFNDKEKLKAWQNNLKGISWTDKEGNILHGAVDNILTKGNKLIVLDYKTRGYALKEDTTKHYYHQLCIYNFLLRKNGYQTENYSYLLFYIPNKVTPTGEVLFDTDLVRIDVTMGDVEEVWKNALKLLNGDCPKAVCDWCKGAA